MLMDNRLADWDSRDLLGSLEKVVQALNGEVQSIFGDAEWCPSYSGVISLDGLLVQFSPEPSNPKELWQATRCAEKLLSTRFYASIQIKYGAIPSPQIIPDERVPAIIVEVVAADREAQVWAHAVDDTGPYPTLLAPVCLFRGQVPRSAESGVSDGEDVTCHN